MTSLNATAVYLVLVFASGYWFPASKGLTPSFDEVNRIHVSDITEPCSSIHQLTDISLLYEVVGRPIQRFVAKRMLDRWIRFTECMHSEYETLYLEQL